MKKLILIMMLGAILPLAAFGDDILEDESYNPNHLSKQEFEAAEKAQQSQVKKKQEMDPQAIAAWGANCAKKTSEATRFCDFEDNATVKTTMQIAKLLARQVEKKATGSAADMCSQVGDLAKSLTAATAAFNAYCSAAWMQCQQACDQDWKTAVNMSTTDPTAEASLTQIKKTKRECGGLEEHLYNAKNNIEKYANLQTMQAKACTDLLNAKNATDPCVKDPKSMECYLKLTQANCTPESKETVCLCKYNPSNPACATYNPNSPYFNSKVPSGTTDRSGLPLDNFGKGGGGGYGNGGSDLVSVPSQSGGEEDNTQGGGGGRGGGDLGGGQNAGAGNGGGGGGGSGLNTKILSGYNGTGSARGGGFGGAGSGQAEAQGGGYGPNGNGRNVDLRQFLPGGKMDPSRGMAGVSGPDGITGPHTDIWKKINNRYFSVKPTLLP